MRFNNKMSINVFTETCLQVPLHDHFLGMKWAHALTDINDRNAGVSICYHPALGQHMVLKTPEILRNRLIALKFTPPGKSPFVIVGLYVPASYGDADKGAFLTTCLSEVNCLRNTYANVIVAGDFNMLLLSETKNMYHGYSKQSLNPERCPGILQSWLDKSDFVHSFQLLRKFPNEKYLTFGMNNMAKGIDHLFVSKNLSSQVKTLKISDFEFAGSRHKSVTISVTNLFVNPLGTKLKFRIPDLVWNSEKFKLNTEQRILKLTNDFSNLKYDQFIAETICAARKISKHLKCDLFEKLNCAIDKNDIDSIKQKIKQLLTKKIRNWKREVSNVIAELDGSSDNVEMADYACSFYSKKYSVDSGLKDEDEIRDFLNASKMKPLFDSVRDKLNTKFSTEEFTELTRKLPVSKSIGPDEISNELLKYKGFDKILSIIANQLMEGGQLPSSMSVTFIRLVHKADDRKLLSNYRPLGITSLAYKIIASAIVNRLSPILPSVIGKHQQGYIKNRSIAPHAKVIQEALFCAVTSNIDSMVTFKTDFEQAFDNVSNKYLYVLLTFLNFGAEIINLIITLNSSLVGLIIMNNTNSKPFDIRRGVVQGSPLSALLFILALEPLLTTAIDDPSYGSFRIFATLMFVLGYCDDLFIFTTLLGLFKWMTLLDKWRYLSGDKLNDAKCLINLIGKEDSVLVKQITSRLAESFQNHGERWTVKVNGDFKNLGTKYSPLNSGTKLLSFTDSTWKDPALKLAFAIVLFNAQPTIFDRVLQVKSKLIPLFSSTEPAAPTTVKQHLPIQRLILAAALNPSCFKKPKIRLEICALPLSHGGLNIPLYAAISQAILLKDLVSNINTSNSWQADLYRRDIMICFDANLKFNNEIIGLPRHKVFLAPLTYLLQLPLRFDQKCTTLLSSPIIRGSFLKFAEFSKLKKTIHTDINFDASTTPTCEDVMTAESLLSQPIFSNILFLTKKLKPLLPSQLCSIFFTLGDIWSFDQNCIDTKLLWDAKNQLELQKKYLTIEERNLYPMNQSDDFVAWKELISTKILDFITWVHPVTLSGNVGNLRMTLSLLEFAKLNQLHHFSYTSELLDTELSQVTVAKLTKHFTVSFCLSKITSALSIPGIKKWKEKHKELEVFDWGQTFALLHNKEIAPIGRDALLKILHRICVPVASRSITDYHRPYMVCEICTCNGTGPLYDHEHALFRCTKVQEFWVLINSLLLKLAGGCFIGKNYGLSITSTFTLATCNIDTQHNSFNIGILTAAQNVMGLALASIVGVSLHGTFTDLKARFCKLLSEYFFNTLQSLTVQCDNERLKFLRLWDFCISKTNSFLNATVVDYKFTPLTNC